VNEDGNGYRDEDNWNYRKLSYIRYISQ
jgi:hypothetical protein